MLLEADDDLGDDVDVEGECLGDSVEGVVILEAYEFLSSDVLQLLAGEADCCTGERVCTPGRAAS